MSIGAGAILKVEGHSLSSRRKFIYSAPPLLPCARPHGWARASSLQYELDVKSATF